MIFEKLADTIVHHHKLIIVIWIVALLYVAPAMTSVNDVLVYQESEMVEGTTEALVAQRIIDEQFPVALANSTIMVVVTGPNVSSPEVRDFCLELGDQASSGGLSYLEEFSSVYSVYEGMVYALAQELGPAGARPLEEAEVDVLRWTGRHIGSVGACVGGPPAAGMCPQATDIVMVLDGKLIQTEAQPV